MSIDRKASAVTTRTLHAAHDALVRRQEDLYAQWRRQEAVVSAVREDLSAGPGDVVDYAAASSALAEEVQRAEVLRGQLDEIDAALHRVDTGAYGRCERCHAVIPPGRLAVFPTATLCVTCKSGAANKSGGT